MISDLDLSRQKNLRVRTRDYKELKEQEDRDEFEDMVLEMLEINEGNKMLITKKKLADK